MHFIFSYRWTNAALPNRVLMLALMLILGTSGAAQANIMGKTFADLDESLSAYRQYEYTGFTKTDGLHEAIAADGVVIKMKRYRPTPDSCYNINGTPVLLFPSIAANMNEFLAHTPPSRQKSFKDMQLPPDLPQWAQNDRFIAEDPMLYYNLGYYLWEKGYDPWFANYRGTGRGDFRSGKMDKNIFNLDVWINLDTPAAIDRVIAVTGKKPFIGGHSTGGLVAYGYLTGAHLIRENPAGEYTEDDVAELRKAFDKGYVPHVKFADDLARERNAKVAGLVGLDPACVPPVPGYAKILLPVINSRMVIPLDGLLDNFVNPFIPGSLLRPVMQFAFGSVKKLDTLFGAGPENGGDPFGYLMAWNASNTDPYMMEFMGRYGDSDMPMRGMGQYFEIGWCGTVTEHWKNGRENKHRQTLGNEERASSYACYDNHLKNITVPVIATLSYYNALVAADQVVGSLIKGKTPHALDEWHIITNTAHVDVIIGKTSPTETFVHVGRWLDQVENK